MFVKIASKTPSLNFKANLLENISSEIANINN